MLEYAAVLVLIASMVAALSNAGIASAVTTPLRAGVEQVFGDADGVPEDDVAMGEPAPRPSVEPNGEVTYSGGDEAPVSEQPAYSFTFSGDGLDPDDIDPDDLVDEDDVVIPDDYATGEEGEQSFWWWLMLVLNDATQNFGEAGEAFGTSVLNDLQGALDAFTTNPVDSIAGLWDAIVNDPVSLLFSDELREAWAEGNWPAIIGHGLWEIGSWAIPGAGWVLKILKTLGKGPGAPNGPDADGESPDADGQNSDPENGAGSERPDNEDSEDTDRDGASCTGNSFLPGTLVLLADGTHRPIEDVAVGDEVLATDPLTGESGPRQVTHLISGTGTKTLVEVTVTDPGGDTGTVTATDEHPFWVPTLQTWVNAEDLQPATWLRTSGGTWAEITAVESWTAPQQRVHNLTVAGLHTYHVAAGGVDVLVHNDSGYDCGGEDPEDILDEIDQQHSPEVADGVDYNMKKAEGTGSDAEDHVISGTDADPRKLAEYLAEWPESRMTHTDTRSGNSIAYDDSRLDTSGRGVLIVRTPYNVHCYHMSRSEFDEYTANGNYDRN